MASASPRARSTPTRLGRASRRARWSSSSPITSASSPTLTGFLPARSARTISRASSRRSATSSRAATGTSPIWERANGRRTSCAARPLRACCSRRPTSRCDGARSPRTRGATPRPWPTPWDRTCPTRWSATTTSSPWPCSMGCGPAGFARPATSRSSATTTSPSPRSRIRDSRPSPRPRRRWVVSRPRRSSGPSPPARCLLRSCFRSSSSCARPASPPRPGRPRIPLRTRSAVPSATSRRLVPAGRG